MGTKRSGPGVSFDAVVPAGETWLHGSLVQHNSILGIVHVPAPPLVEVNGVAEEGDSVVIETAYAQRYAKASGVAFDEVGLTVYWDPVEDEITDLAMGATQANVYAGTTYKTAEAGDAWVHFVLPQAAFALVAGALGVAEFGYFWQHPAFAIPLAGAMAPALSANDNTVGRRTPAASSGRFRFHVDLPSDSRAKRGLKLIAYTIVYAVDTADVGTALTFELATQQAPDDNTIMAAPTVVAGQLDAHYDTEHDTFAKRADSTSAPEPHTALVTLPTPVLIEDGMSAFIDAKIDDTGGGTSEVDVYGFGLYYAIS